MSRTNRNYQYACINARRVRHHNYLVAESAAIEELLDLGYTITSNRLRSRPNNIVTDYDDLAVSSYKEVFHYD